MKEYRGSARCLMVAAALCLVSVSGVAWAQSETAPDGAGAASAGQAPANHPVTNQACESCHAPRRIPTVDTGVLAHSVHGGLHCTDCHTDISSVPHPKRLQPVDCGACHRGIASRIKLGAHAPGSTGGNRQVPGCTDCHGTHGIARVDSAAFRNVIALRCADCHEEHYKGYMDRFHGQAAALGMARAPRCSDCHDPHRPLPQIDPRSRIAAANLVTTCGACHKNINANFTKFDPHPQPRNRAHSPFVYYSKMFMVTLLEGVFGFFGLHTALWLQRSLVAQARGEIPPPVVDGQYVRRFSMLDRGMHVVVIITFMLLAMTGLPLMYASTSWAHFLSRLFGGEPAMRTIHIISGLVTLGYFFTHVGAVIYRFARTRDWTMFYGPDSMMPRAKDFIDMARNFAWFLYLAPRPRLDRWAYWEKFDYWAVFWGVAMIGTSGLMLARPELTARLLPGQVLNVAAVVHGEEALLAVGFIFLFHFFHNYLRPEDHPTDLSIFTGRLPLERFKRDRPLQYERLVREGRLETILVDPPSRRSVTLWTIFGTAVVVAGLALILAVALALLAG